MKDSLKKIVLSSAFILFAFLFLSMPNMAKAAAPTGTSAVMNNVDTVGHNVDFVVTGTDFVSFVSSGTATANGTDLGFITFNGFTATSAIIANPTTMTVQFDYRSVGTGKIGQTFAIAAGHVQDGLGAGIPNLLISIGAGSITDSAKPVLLSLVLSKTASANRLTFTYSEPVVVANGASSVTIGDTSTAGTVTGLGSFATGGNVVVATTKNTVAGSGTTAVTVDLAAQSGGFMTAASTTEPSGVFTPVVGAQVADANGNQVEVGGTPTASGTGTWDLIKPTIAATTITVSDAAGANGRIDRAVLVFPEAMRSDSFTNADGHLGAGGSTTGSFSGGGATWTFNKTVDDNVVDTSAAGGDFTYSGMTTPLADLFGNLLSTATPGTIVTADKAETDGARPVVVSTSPVNASINQNNTANIVVTFSEAMTTGSLTNSTFTTKDDLGTLTGDTYTVSWNGPHTVANLSHPIYREKGHVYHAALTTGVTDASAGLNTLVPFSWTFTPIASGSSTTVAASTADITAPTNTSVSIAGGATKVSSANVTLTLAATDATDMMIANTPDFYGAAFEPYATSKAWSLNSGDGTRTVYAKFKDAAGNVSNFVSDDVIVDSSLIPAVAPAAGTTTVSTTTTTGTPAVPATPATPAVPATSTTPAIPAVAATPATPANPGTITTTITNTNASGVTVVSVFTAPVKYGAKGNEVKKLQQFLKDKGHLKGKVDGSFGPATKAALKAFQKANGLTADGIFGAKTLKKINDLM